MGRIIVRADWAPLLLCILLRAFLSIDCARAAERDYPVRGYFELALEAAADAADPYADDLLRITFQRPDGTEVRVDGFYDGGRTYKGRAYCDAAGTWRWRSQSPDAGLNGKSGRFKVAASDLPGKLRVHPDDGRQFARDNGQWFLHIGDTGYRYVTQTEPKWREYIDQAGRAGFTKVRTWFCQGRSDVQILFAAEDRTRLNLPYWQEIERRLLYALEVHPQIVFQLIPYGEDTDLLRRYDSGDAGAKLIARYAQARFSALPNVTWCISNDRIIVKDGVLKNRDVYGKTIDRIGRDMAGREPWGTLLTNHQARFSGYGFVDAPWSDIITIEDMDQVDGRVILEYRRLGGAPIVNDEDRYEHWRNPAHDRYFFRRLMWASLLSGGFATYGGLRTYEPYDGNVSGVQGYYDAVDAGKLERGADDFVHIHTFFRESGLTLIGFEPDDAAVGGDPQRFKCIRRGTDCYVVYLANPDGPTPEKADAAKRVPAVTVNLAEGNFEYRWFDPRSGGWTERKATGGGRQTLTAPAAKDWVLLITGKGFAVLRD
ncbi:MAG: DUF4038 domain-containing protein [Phycisphaerae bacterium]|nr:DUF4038 domain-containing protein [Phycisphaerae bacterium]